MVVPIIHKLIVKDGRYIQLPPWVDGDGGYGNLSIPNLSVADTIQKYPFGTKFVDGDRVFKYSKFMGTMNPDLGGKNTRPQAIAFATIAADAAQYATSVVIDVAATDGRGGDGAIAANELAGGYLVVFDASNKAFTRQISANTATTGAGEMTLTLTASIPLALIGDTDHGECMANPYTYLTPSTSAAYMVMGMPQLVYTSGQFGWVQNWGPSWIAPQSAVGSGSNNFLCIFRHDGSVDELDYSDSNNNKGQIAGYVMTHAQGGGQGAPFIWLTIGTP